MNSDTITLPPLSRHLAYKLVDILARAHRLSGGADFDVVDLGHWAAMALGRVPEGTNGVAHETNGAANGVAK